MKRFLFILLYLFPLVGHMQDFSTSYDPERDYKEGLRLFNEKRYGAAQYFFDRIVDKEKRIGFTDIAADAEYFAALCAIELHNADAEERILRFVENHPGNVRIIMAYFHRGRHLYRLKNYTEAARWFDKVSRQDLTRDQLSEFYFKKGYCAYITQNFKLASLMFYELLDLPNTDYYEPGLYYYSHMEYEKKNYQTALQGFEKLADSRAFGSLTPYYIAQIYFLQQRFDKAIEYIPRYLDKVVPARKAEMLKIMGNSYFRLQNYDSAIVYIEKFKEAGEGFERYDLYQLGYAYYKVKKYEEATKNLSLVTNTPDALSQNAFYHMGASYLALNDKKNAHLAFGNAYKLDFSKEIQEDALFNYAKLTYELSFAPFAETIRTFEEYLEKFPNSPRKNEVYDYLVKVYLTGKNYREALASMDRIKDKSPVLENARQRTAFFHAVELFTNQNYREAKINFEKSLASKGNDIFTRAMATYWLAETCFKLNDYQTALDYYNEFLKTPGSYNSREYGLAHYNIGYIYFLQKEYAQAQRWFSLYTAHPGRETSFTIDAYLRLGDGFFAQRQFAPAIEKYNKAIELSYPANEYAVYQKGISLGLLGNQEAKIKTLEFFYSNNTSVYADAAIFEIGRAYARLLDYKNALEAYQYLVYNYPNSKYFLRSQLQCGLMAYNLGENQKAIDFMKRVVERYPNTPEATEAIATLRPIYVSMDDIEGYLAYMRTIHVEIAQSSQDSLLYQSAEKLYIDREYQRAIKSLNEYTTRFPNGHFTAPAYYFKGHSALKLADSTQAIESFKAILLLPRNMYSVLAAQQLAPLQFEKQDYSGALDSYQLLLELADNETLHTESRIGIMRSLEKLNQHKETITAANQVLKISSIPQNIRIEATYNRAKSYQALNLLDSALIDYQTLSENTRIPLGAEARFRVAEIYYLKENPIQAEKIIFGFIKESTPHFYWLGKSFILLSTIYKEKNDHFQAKAYLQSLLANYPNDTDGIKQQATDMLNQIMAMENQQFENRSQPVIIDMK